VLNPPSPSHAGAQVEAAPSGSVLDTVVPPSRAASIRTPSLDPDSAAWIERLRPDNPEREAAIESLHRLLVKAARYEVARRAATLPQLRGNDQEDLAQQSADDSLVAVLDKLETFRGDSRFTTWAYKFALLEAGVKVRRRAWQGREVPVESESWDLIADSDVTPQHELETTELLGAVKDAIEADLSPHQREVLVAVTLNGVPIDVLAERLATTRGALYKTIHDARAKLRTALRERGLSVEGQTGGASS